MLGVVVYFCGALLAKRHSVVVKDDYLGFHGRGLTLESACDIVRRTKSVPVSFRNLKSGEMQLRLQSIEFSGDGPCAVLGKVIAGLEGGTPVGLTHWFENEHFYVGRKDA